MFARFKASSLTTKQYFFIGLTIGIIISLNIERIEQEPERSACDAALHQNGYDEGSEFEPKLNLASKPMQAKKPNIKNIVRPRYYTSELGIREKLFVAALAKVETIETTATAFNKTVAHLVDKIKYFINAENVKYNFKLKNIVGFTDTRENLRPYHVLKYVADNYLNDYDYFLFVPDTVYLNARVLVERLKKVSVSADIYMGTKRIVASDSSGEVGEENYCDLNAGVILSNSLIKKIRANLDWCVRNAVTNHHHINLGKCIKYSSEISECQTSYQNISFTQYKLNNYKIYRDLHYLKDEPLFNDATMVYPITSPDDFYLLHIYFSRVNLQNLNEELELNKLEYSNVKYGNLPDTLLEKKWPVGVPESKPAENRHDIITWQYMNETHLFMWNTEENTRELPPQDKLDLKNIIRRILLQTSSNYPDLMFSRVQSIYKKYDHVRGSDYIFHINFIKKSPNGQTTEIIKSFEVVKPLGAVEIVQSPYVTEGSRVTLLVPIFPHQIRNSVEFINRYEKLCLQNRENTFLMLVFLYNEDESANDKFSTLKTMAKNLADIYKSDGPRIAWVSIRLPDTVKFEEKEKLLNSIYGEKEVLSLAVADLALRKIGLDSLVLMIPATVKFYPDFLNRVRMNTIQNFQVYSPVGFFNYPCKFTTFCKDCEACDVSQASGYFDTKNFDVMAFYGKDYVEARKSLESHIPIVRKDKDIEALFTDSSTLEISGITDLFINHPNNIHILRAIEPNLRHGEAFSTYLSDKTSIDQCYSKDYLFANQCMRIGSQKQLSEAIAQFEGESE